MKNLGDFVLKTTLHKLGGSNLKEFQKASLSYKDVRESWKLLISCFWENVIKSWRLPLAFFFKNLGRSFCLFLKNVK